MPRKAKEEIKKEEKEIVKKAPVSKKSTSVSKTSSRKTTSKKSTSKTKKTVEKVSAVNSASKTKKVNNSKKVTSKSSSKKTSVKKASNNKTTSKKAEIIEYYDLPYRYNETIVKVLAQTPNTLFVYWDISDEDRKKYIEEYGEYFFNNTKPVLEVYNRTNNTKFEVDINDFANSWYLHVLDSDCDYKIELGRRPINEYVKIENDYLYVTSSNETETPNDHILFDHLNNNIYFKNVKTNNIIKNNIINLSLLKKIGNISDIKDFYKELYPEEIIDFDKLDLRNPSSSNPTSSFK